MSSLGAIDPIIVARWDGFDQPERARVTPTLGDGTAATGNSVMQSTALGWGVARLSGTITASADLVLLKGYADDKTSVAFVHDSVTYVVRVFDLRTTRLQTPDDEAWTYTCTLHQTG